jgi:hypothetical protein
MRRLAQFCVCVALLFATNQTGAALIRMDDFELLAAGTNIDGTTPNADPAGPGMGEWDTHSEDTGFVDARKDPSGAFNMVLAAHGYSGSARACVLARSGSSGQILDYDEASQRNGEVGTVFVRFYVDSADPNVEAYFGVGSASNVGNTDRDRIRAGVVVYNDPGSGLGLYQAIGGGSISSGAHSHLLLQNLEFDRWYNLWVVVDRTGAPSIDIYDAYLNTSGADATAADRIVDDAPFSNSTEFNLKGFHAVFEVATDEVYFDDIYMDDDAESLTNPADEEQLDTVDVTLQWKTGVDPTNTSQPNPAITKHYLYLIPVHPNDVVDWTSLLVEIPAGSPPNPTASHGPLSLSPNKTYWWVVDESISNSGPTNPATILGRIWSFETLKTVPEIIDGPIDAFVYENETAKITIDVNSVSQEHYAWYKGPVGETTNPIGSDSNTLTIANVRPGNEGTYWCRVTNDGGSIDSGTGLLVVKRLLAHWTLDQSDYQGGQYLDVSGNGHHADITGVPTFVGDPAGNPSAAVQVSPAGGYATAGTWDPSAVSNSLTVTAWINPTTSGANPGIVSKRESWGDENMRWTVNLTDDDLIRFITDSGGALRSDDSVPLNEWTHVACSYDVTTDEAKIYINGEDAATDTDFALDSNDVATLRIGHYDGSITASDIFPGGLDDIRIYNYGLTIVEAADLYYQMTGKSVCLNPPEARFDLDGNCRVDFADFALFAVHWLECGLFPETECQ